MHKTAAKIVENSDLYRIFAQNKNYKYGNS